MINYVFGPPPSRMLQSAMVLASLLSVSASAVAQTSIYTLVPPEGTISVGRQVESALSRSDATRDNGAYLEVWTFEGRSGQQITIDLMADDFDAYLLLVGPGFDDPVTNDDGGDGFNSQITATLLETGDYQVVATSLSSSSTGTYQLRISEGDGVQGSSSLARFAEDADYLPIGERRSGVLAVNDPVVNGERHGQGWILNGRSGESVTINMESDEFDTYLFVAGPGIDGYTTDDDGADGSNSQITLTFTSSDEYVVIASGFGNSSSGAYTIRATTMDMGTQEEIEVGERRSRVLADNAPTHFDGRAGHNWSLRGRRGQTVTITMQSEEFDTYIYLHGPGLGQGLEDDDSAGDFDSRLTVTFPETGDYTITTSALSGSGGYTLEVATAGVTESLGELRIGRTVRDILPSNAPEIYDGRPGHVWTFSGRRDETVTITLRSEEFDTYLYVNGPGMGSRLSDDDSAGDLDSRITFRLPESGEYQVVASALSSGSGSYTLEAATARGATTEGRLRSGDRESGFLDSNASLYENRPAQFWEYRADDGETVTFEVTSYDFDAYMYIEGPGLSSVLSDDDSGEDNGARITVTFPESGTYRIIAAMYSTSSDGGEYTISATRR